MTTSRTSKTSTANKPAAKKKATTKAVPKKVPKSAPPASAKKTPVKKGAAAKKAAAPKNVAAKKPVAKKAPAAKKPAAKKAPAAKKPAAKKAPVTKNATKAAPEASTKAPASSPSKTKASTTLASRNAAAVKSAKKADLPDYLKDKKWLEVQKALLIEERARYTRSAKSLADEAAQLMADREPGDVQFDEESGEGDTIAVERDRDLALSAKARESVDEIDAAFERMEKGTYGICTTGGDFIPKERLEAIPEASICVQHKTAMF